ncbi:hypothetical protein, partial [Prevotella dentasini]|uniref:hypothetical protein n=1 Tax=Prevotella dentasini TaxID=589537 RepID=UPI001F2D0FF2
YKFSANRIQIFLPPLTASRPSVPGLFSAFGLSSGSVFSVIHHFVPPLVQNVAAGRQRQFLGAKWRKCRNFCVSLQVESNNNYPSI